MESKSGDLRNEGGNTNWISLVGINGMVVDGMVMDGMAMERSRKRKRG